MSGPRFAQRRDRVPALSAGVAAARRWLDRIWHIEGDIALAPGQSGSDAFGRLAPLFRENGTTIRRDGSDTLTFSKTDPGSQDVMAVFDRGTLDVRHGPAAPVLHYRLVSQALLCCFLAPLLFLAFAQATKAVAWLDGPSAATDKKDKTQVQLPHNPIDKALGSPAPEPPKAKKAGEDKKPSPKAAYIFAGLFAVLYSVGRVLESRMIAAAFTKRLRMPS